MVINDIASLTIGSIAHDNSNRTVMFIMNEVKEKSIEPDFDNKSINLTRMQLE